MNKVHQKTRELIASLPDRDLPALHHLLVLPLTETRRNLNL